MLLLSWKLGSVNFVSVYSTNTFRNTFPGISLRGLNRGLALPKLSLTGGHTLSTQILQT